MRAAAAALLLAPALAAGAAGIDGRPGTGARVEAYFTPGDDATQAVVGRIDAARHGVQVQAYLFTSRRIAAALARAARRGVAVELVGDAKQWEAGGLPVLRSLGRAGVRIWLTDAYAAFHHKTVVVDAGGASPVVITGSFNFTRAAQESNAENLVVITGDVALARRFARDFERHRAGASRLQ